MEVQKSEPHWTLSSKRYAGTLVTKSMGSISRDQSRRMSINFVFPAINSTLEKIKVQQDNVRPRIELIDCEFPPCHF